MSKVLLDEVGDSEVSSVSLDRVQGLPVSDSSFAEGYAEHNPTLLEVPLQSVELSQRPTVSLSRLEERQVAAQEQTAQALTSIATFLSGVTLKDILQHQAVNGAVHQILGGLAAKDGRNALDARTMKQNAVDIAYLIEQVLGKVTSHALSRSREVHDGEELQGFKKD